MQGRVGVQRFLAAAQDDGIAALDAQAGRIDRDVGPRLVDEEDDAERHADLVNLQAVGPHVAVEDAADRIGQRGDFAKSGCRGADTVRRQAEAIDAGGGKPRLGGGVNVSGVGRQDLVGAFLEGVGGGQEPAIFPAPRAADQQA